ncbi:MAG: TldD/PmbA family protein, partial [Microcoleus sp. SIO2G3]|nr:TldD/PmbA family protein [Microcoleus sp. SIO2G3]
MISELSQALAAIDLPADWIGLRAVKSGVGMATVRDGLPQRNGRSHSQGVMVEVLAGGQIGYSAVNSLRLPDLQAAAEAAYRQAIAASQWAIFPASIATRPKVVGQYVSPVQKAIDLLSPGEVNEILVRLCREMAVSESIVQTSATAVTEETETWFVSSNGSEVHQQFVMLETHFGATAQDGAIVQRRSSNGYLAHSYQGGWELFLTPELWNQAKTVGEQAIELLNSEECPSETTTLVLAPDQMMLQIHESVGHPLELDRILGDERNYAGGSFVKPADFGQLS